jgi:hypothetical protein
MFPDRVGRMVLDGVMDAVTARGPIFPANIRDAEYRPRFVLQLLRRSWRSDSRRPRLHL